jgi:hypothetical protein
MREGRRERKERDRAIERMKEREKELFFKKKRFQMFQLTSIS